MFSTPIEVTCWNLALTFSKKWDDTLSRFDILSQCDRQMDGQTELQYQHRSSAILC